MELAAKSQSTSTWPLSANFQSRLFRGLSRFALETVVCAATRLQIPADSVVLNQGDPPDRMFLLVSGSGRYIFYTPSGRRLLLISLSAGDLFGGAALLEEPSPYLCGVELAKRSGVLVWEREKIRELATRFPRLLENALSVASDYLVWYVATHVALTCHTAAERVAHVLINLARGIGTPVQGGIALDITNEQLADASSVTLFTVSRLTAEWSRSHLISKRRGRIVLRFPDRLLASTVKESGSDKSSHFAPNLSSLAGRHK